MTTAMIHDKIKELIREQKGKDFQIREELSIQEDFFTDSVEFMEFIITLEDAFKIEISDENAESFKSMADIVTYIEKESKL